MSDLANEIRRRAAGLSEYFWDSRGGLSTAIPYRALIARQHGGLTEADNLALACWACNLKKGPNLTGIDPQAKASLEQRVR